MKEYIELRSQERAREEGYVYKPDEAKKKIDFLHKYWKPQFSKPPFQLLQFQTQYFNTLFGFRHVETNLMLYNQSIFSTPKKNSKTETIAQLSAIYGFTGLDQPSPVVSIFSITQDNATQVWNALRWTINNDPHLRALSNGGRKVGKQLEIYVPFLNSNIKIWANNPDGTPA